MNYEILQKIPKTRLIHALDSLISKGILSESDIDQELNLSNSIPTYIFTKDLGILESTVKYLKQEQNLKLSKIAKLINRNPRTIWSTYRKSIKKQDYQKKDKFIIIPISVFSNRAFPPLKSLVKYLKEECSLRYSEIAGLISRDQRTIWVTYNRKG